jgi:hypothetical protein
VSAGYDFSCAALTDGTAKCWGYNGHGELGDGTLNNRSTAVAVSGLSLVKKISLGSYHSCALLTNNTAKCWGYNAQGQLGDGTVTYRTSPVAVSDLPAASDISAGGSGTCAILLDASPRCWGQDNYGQSGDGSTSNTTSPIQAPAGISGKTLTQFGVSSTSTCALVSDGTTDDHFVARIVGCTQLDFQIEHVTGGAAPCIDEALNQTVGGQNVHENMRRAQGARRFQVMVAWKIIACGNTAASNQCHSNGHCE